jgi:hypothetical protein
LRVGRRWDDNGGRGIRQAREMDSSGRVHAVTLTRAGVTTIVRAGVGAPRVRAAGVGGRAARRNSVPGGARAAGVGTCVGATGPGADGSIVARAIVACDNKVAGGPRATGSSSFAAGGYAIDSVTSMHWAVAARGALACHLHRRANCAPGAVRVGHSRLRGLQWQTDYKLKRQQQ